MRDLELGRLVRVLRRRRGWRQVDCAQRAGVHRSTWADIEGGRLSRVTTQTLRRCMEVLEVSLDLVPRWRGSGLDRLLDQDHAALQAAWADRLRQWGYDVRVETSFNHFGDRGRIDLLAWHAGLRLLLVGEIKTDLVDAQGLLGPLDVKCRVAPRVGEMLGWDRPQRVVPLLIIRDRSTVRDRLRRLEPLFSSFALRGRRATSCLRHPEMASSPMLILSDLRTAAQGSLIRVGGERVRIPRPRASTNTAAHEESGWARPG